MDSNSRETTYRVHLQREMKLGERLMIVDETFDCLARNREDAAAQAMAAYPGSRVTSFETNENVLEGFDCPHCGSLRPFDIAATAVFRVYDDGTDEHGDVEWDDADTCTCVACGHRGTVAQFRGGIAEDHATAEGKTRLAAAAPALLHALECILSHETIANPYRLAAAVEAFEQATGQKWGGRS